MTHDEKPRCGRLPGSSGCMCLRDRARKKNLDKRLRVCPSLAAGYPEKCFAREEAKRSPLARNPVEVERKRKQLIREQERFALHFL